MMRMVVVMCLLGGFFGGMVRAEDETDFRDMIPGIPEPALPEATVKTPAPRPNPAPELRHPPLRVTLPAPRSRRDWPTPELTPAPTVTSARRRTRAPQTHAPQALIMLPDKVRPTTTAPAVSPVTRATTWLDDPAPRTTTPIQTRTTRTTTPTTTGTTTGTTTRTTSSTRATARQYDAPRQALPMLSTVGGTAAIPARRARPARTLPPRIAEPLAPTLQTFTEQPPAVTTARTRVVETISTRPATRATRANGWPATATTPSTGVTQIRSVQPNALPLIEEVASVNSRTAPPVRADVQAMVGNTTVADRGFNQVVARFNGVTFTRLDLYTVMERTYGRQALDRLLMPILLRGALAKRNLKIDQKDLAETLRMQLLRMTPAGEKNPNLEKLTQTWFKMSLAEYQQVVVWPEVAIRQLVLHDLNVTDDDVLSYYYAHQKDYMQPEMVEVAHILISPITYLPAATRKNPQRRLAIQPQHWQKAHTEALRVHEKLRAGYDFAALAKEASHDPKTRKKGGKLGEFARGKLLKEVEDAAFALVPGQYSELVKTMYGYHILYLLNKKPRRASPYRGAIKVRARAAYIASLTETYAMRLLTRLKLQAMQRQELIISERVLQGGE